MKRTTPTFAARLLALRERAGLSREDLAGRAGLTRMTIYSLGPGPGPGAGRAAGAIGGVT